MTYTLNLTTEEWSAAVTALQLPDPLGLDGIAGPVDGEPDTAALAVGARSLLGRGLFDPADSDNDVHPWLVGLLLALLEADEVVVVDTAYPGAATTNGWYVAGGVGVSMTQDVFTNLQFRVAPADEVIAQARQALTALAPATPAREQYPVDPAVLGDVLAAFGSDGEQPAPALPTGATSRLVSFLAHVRGWTRDGSDAVESGLVVVGLGDHGTWVVDDGGSGVPVLTQLRPPWPDSLQRFGG